MVSYSCGQDVSAALGGGLNICNQREYNILLIMTLLYSELILIE